MQERERARLQKMGTCSLQTDSLLQSRKKRTSFSLPSFRRSSGAGERQEVARSEASSAEEAARVQKAAAWQWYTRGVGEAVVPTKRPPVGKSPASQAPIDEKSVSSKAMANNSNVLQYQSSRGASRFKAEARLARPNSAGAQPTPSAPSPAPSTPLYDEFELSGLRTQMADFVQRLQSHQQTKDHNEQLPGLPSKPLHIAIDGRASVSTDHQHTKAPPNAAAAISSELQLSTKPTPSAAPFHMRPFSALHKLFRKVVSGSIIKSTKESPLIINSSPAFYIEPELEENPQYHYHHYIHHHHHHYHYGEGPEGRGAIIRSRRRHSESSDIRPHIPSPWEEESIEEEEEAERRSPFEAYQLTRRRRHSETFAARVTPKKSAVDEEEEMKEESAKGASPLLPRRYNSERFSPNKCPAIPQPARGVTDEEFLGIKNRRHSAENSREAVGGGKSGGGTYKLTGAEDCATPAKPLVRRRHSEGLQRPEGVQYEMGKHTPSPGWSYWQSPSARYLEDVLERQVGASAIANAAPARRPRPPRDLPPIYPQ